MPTGQLADSQSALGMLEREFDTVATGMFQSLMSLVRKACFHWLRSCPPASDLDGQRVSPARKQLLPASGVRTGSMMGLRVASDKTRRDVGVGVLATDRCCCCRRTSRLIWDACCTVV